MTRFTDAALLRGAYAEMLKNQPKDSEWKNTSCENSAEAVSQEIAKHIFSMQKNIDPEKERLEVFAYSAKGAIKVIRIFPGEADLIRIDGTNIATSTPVSVVQHASLLSLTFAKEPIKEGQEKEDEGMKIGFVIFDELSRRKKSREADGKKQGKSKTSSKKRSNR